MLYKKGDLVKVEREDKSSSIWVSKMSECIGCIFTVMEDTCNSGVLLDTHKLIDENYYFPEESIVLVSRASFNQTSTFRMYGSAEDGNYKELCEVFLNAYSQAAIGKGFKRHANGLPFTKQPIMWIEKYFKSYQLGQAVKKMEESQRLGVDQAVNELLGAINFIAARILFLKGEGN